MPDAPTPAPSLVEAGLDLNALRKVAKAATEGEWEPRCMGSEGYAVIETKQSKGKRRKRVAFCGYEDWDTDKANASFIATFDPPTVLALLSTISAQEERLAALEKALRGWAYRAGPSMGNADSFKNAFYEWATVTLAEPSPTAEDA